MTDQPPFAFTSAKPKADAQGEAQKGGAAPERTVANIPAAASRTSARTAASSRRGFTDEASDLDIFLALVDLIKKRNPDVQEQIISALRRLIR